MQNQTNRWILMIGLYLTLITINKCDTNSTETDLPEETTTEPTEPVNFCDDNYVDSAYFNGYDIIVTRDDWLWYYYRDKHNLSVPFSQKDFTQGDHIQGAFNISKIPKCSVKEVVDCKEILKMKNMAVYFLHNKSRARSYYNLDVRSRDGSQKRVKSKQLPWAMKQVGLLGGNLWPNGWEAYQEYRPVAFLPSRYEMIFIINGRNFSNSILAWNTLDTKNWNSSWRYKDIKDQVVFTGMFEMNGIIYAIGETKNSIERIGKIYRYHIDGQASRKLTETNQMVTDFFGCPERILKSYTLVNTIRTGRDIRTGSVLNNKLTTKDDDSILISIFIGIVITACLTTIILSFVTITGRKKSAVESDLRIAPTIPKLPVIGLDYSRRQTSQVSGFDTMSSITAIYSQINRPVNSKHNRTHTHKSSNSNGTGPIKTTVNGITAANTTAVNGISNGIQTHHFDDEDFEDSSHCFYVLPASERSSPLNRK